MGLKNRAYQVGICTQAGGSPFHQRLSCSLSIQRDITEMRKHFLLLTVGPPACGPVGELFVEKCESTARQLSVDAMHVHNCAAVLHEYNVPCRIHIAGPFGPQTPLSFPRVEGPARLPGWAAWVWATPYCSLSCLEQLRPRAQFKADWRDRQSLLISFSGHTLLLAIGASSRMSLALLPWQPFEWLAATGMWNPSSKGTLVTPWICASALESALPPQFPTVAGPQKEKRCTSVVVRCTPVRLYACAPLFLPGPVPSSSPQPNLQAHEIPRARAPVQHGLFLPPPLVSDQRPVLIAQLQTWKVNSLLFQAGFQPYRSAVAVCGLCCGLQKGAWATFCVGPLPQPPNCVLPPPLLLNGQRLHFPCCRAHRP